MCLSDLEQRLLTRIRTSARPVTTKAINSSSSWWQTGEKLRALERLGYIEQVGKAWIACVTTDWP